jgi:protein TonB
VIVAALREFSCRLLPHEDFPLGAVNQRFWAILGLSILFRAVLFALIAWQRQNGPRSLLPLLASIRLIAVHEPGAVAAAAPAPATVPQKVRQDAIRMEWPAPRVTQPAGPANVPTQTPAPSAEMAAVDAAPVAKVVPSEHAVSAQRPQGEVLEAYRRRLGELPARHQKYPRVAALRGWEGEVRLRLKVARKGNLRGVALDRSSGFEVLDQHALAMLEALAGLPPLPEALDRNEILVVVPINFKLKKAT